MKQSHPYELIDNKEVGSLTDQVLLNQKPLSDLCEFFDKNKFLAVCLVDDKFAKKFGFFKLNKHNLKKIINICHLDLTLKFVHQKIPSVLVKHLTIKNFFLSKHAPVYWKEYKKHNKIKTTFRELFSFCWQDYFFVDAKATFIVNNVDYLMRFCDYFEIPTKPIIGHPFKNWNIKLDELDHREKNKIDNFKRLFKNWY